MERGSAAQLSRNSPLGRPAAAVARRVGASVEDRAAVDGGGRCVAGRRDRPAFEPPLAERPSDDHIGGGSDRRAPVFLLTPRIDAVQTLLALQDQYREWRDALPESLAGSATAELLEQVCDLDLSELEAVELPRGFGVTASNHRRQLPVGGQSS